MKNYLIIHGHFYQPPREDPDTGIIPRQASAAPYKNWNERITRECYAANAFSRILGPDGRITEIVNNYQYLSFNFGPTLLHWIREHAPGVYERILEADRGSAERNSGHGNGIAQGYNHTILPLDNPVNCETQIVWGMEDFRFHFGREPEGIWLPETAVNDRVLDCLIGQGIKFIILSPWQAAGWRGAGTKKWQEITDGPIASDKAYYLKRPGGTISVFFYNHILASGISFNHFLHSADALYEKLLSFADFRRQGHLINIATDGEIYGHHEPYGDMCIAALSKIILQKKEFVLTNYGSYLELFPPESEVRLKKGEEERGTSWSCHHGVSRWYKDCGCSTGGREGWNQKWRTPLRQAFSGLFEKVYKLYEKQMQKLSSKDPQEIRNRYISVLTGSVSPAGFARECLLPEKGEDEKARTLFLSLLEGQKYAMFMFTSCGWFFADISGLEPVQNIRYAYMAIQFYRAFTGEDLFTILEDYLEKAQSNITSLGTGKDIAGKRVIERWRNAEYIAAVFCALYWIQKEQMDRTFGNYRAASVAEEEEHKVALTVEHTFTGQAEEYTASISGPGENSYAVLVSEAAKKEPVKFPMYTLPVFVRELLYRHLSAKAELLCTTLGEDILDLLEDNFATGKSLKVTVSQMMHSAAETFLLSRLHAAVRGEPGKGQEKMNSLMGSLSLMNRYHIQFDRDIVRKGVSTLLARWIDKIIETPEKDQIHNCMQLLEGLRKGEIEPDLTIPQNRLYGYLRTMSFVLSSGRKADLPQGKILDLLPELALLGNMIGLDADRMLEQFISRREKS